jgi:hypothetical protein
MGAGAPTKYEEEYCDAIVEYFSVPPQTMGYKKEYFMNGAVKSEVPIVMASEFPTFQGFADHIGVHVDTLHEWKSIHPEFSEAYARAKQLQEKIWLVNGMGNLYNAQFAKFFGTNCLGYKEKIETQNENVNRNYDMSTLTDEQIDKILAEDATDQS